MPPPPPRRRAAAPPPVVLLPPPAHAPELALLQLPLAQRVATSALSGAAQWVAGAAASAVTAGGGGGGGGGGSSSGSSGGGVLPLSLSDGVWTLLRSLPYGQLAWAAAGGSVQVAGSSAFALASYLAALPLTWLLVLGGYVAVFSLVDWAADAAVAALNARLRSSSSNSSSTASSGSGSASIGSGGGAAHLSPVTVLARALRVVLRPFSVFAVGRTVLKVAADVPLLIVLLAAKKAAVAPLALVRAVLPRLPGAAAAVARVATAVWPLRMLRRRGAAHAAAAAADAAPPPTDAELEAEYVVVTGPARGGTAAAAAPHPPTRARARKTT